jgi:biotin carboxyl carrier protein
MRFVVTLDGQPTPVDVRGAEGRYRVTLGERVWEVDARFTAPGLASLLIDGTSYIVDLVEQDVVTVVEVGGEVYPVQIEEEARYVIRTRGGTAGGQGGQTLMAPLPGRVTHVAVAPGQAVTPGQTLVVIEAMKMENEFTARQAGTVAEVRVVAGQAVNAGDVLLVIGP